MLEVLVLAVDRQNPRWKSIVPTLSLYCQRLPPICPQFSTARVALARIIHEFVRVCINRFPRKDLWRSCLFHHAPKVSTCATRCFWRIPATVFGRRLLSPSTPYLRYQSDSICLAVGHIQGLRFDRCGRMMKAPSIRICIILTTSLCH